MYLLQGGLAPVSSGNWSRVSVHTGQVGSPSHCIMATPRQTAVHTCICSLGKFRVTNKANSHVLPGENLQDENAYIYMDFNTTSNFFVLIIF